MAKWAADVVMDGALDVIAGSTIMHACSAQPTTWADLATYTLANVVMAPADFAKAQGDAGVGTRKVTVAQKTGVSVTGNGTATHVALGKTTGSVLNYVTTCTSQALTSGNTMTFNAWKVEIGAPT